MKPAGIGIATNRAGRNLWLFRPDLDRGARNQDHWNKGTTHVKTLLANFKRDESGATAIEYGLIASLIAVAIIAGATALGTALNTTFNTLSTKMK